MYSVLVEKINGLKKITYKWYLTATKESLPGFSKYAPLAVNCHIPLNQLFHVHFT